jgi:ferrous iron transport protein B
MESVFLIGKPNSGKSLLFNRLTGLKQKVANFPGVTVDIKSGRFDSIELVDFPGVYTLTPFTEDEKVALNQFKARLRLEGKKKILCVLDGTRLEKSLLLALQVRQVAADEKLTILFALNMMDEVEKNRAQINIEEIEKKLKAPVLPISAKTGAGMDRLKELLNSDLSQDHDFSFTKDASEYAQEIYRDYGPNKDVFLIKQGKLDRLFLSSSIGGPLFILIMLLLFQSVFTWAGPLMDAVEFMLEKLGAFIGPLLPIGWFKDFVLDALIGGVGSFLVFAPQIMVLSFIIGILEDSGYLARAAVIVHRPLSWFGLSGKSFVPYLTGHACAIPAIIAARTIESPQKRFLTILTIPFMACSARLPVYALLVAVLVPSTKILGGFITLQGLSFFLLYLLGLGTALIVSGIIHKMKLNPKQNVPFVIELTPYRLPSLKPILQKSLQSTLTFIKKAGPVIFIVTVIVWVLGYFPNGQGNLQNSWLSSIGKFIQPLFSPLGLDWRYGVAILSSFVAREVFVGTLGTFFGIESADDNLQGLVEQVQADGLTLASGMGLLVFYALALQCASTLAVIKQETGSGKVATLTFIGYTLLAYVSAVVAYQIFTLFS